MVLKDSCGRPLLNLRIAVTQRCNLRCEYCHMEGEERTSQNTADEMTAEEIVRIADVAVRLGISRIKLTGGEPLMREDIREIVKDIAATPGLDDLSMTTNGTLLTSVAKELRQSGLKRINISLPTLDAQVYHKLTGGKVEDTLAGINAAVDAGFSPIKLNMLILNGANDSAVPQMIEFAAETGTILQVIELEPLNVSDGYYAANHKSLDELEATLKEKAVRVTARPRMQNRRVYDLPNTKVEVVPPIENSEFCAHCTRLRVTSDGKLKPCLMSNGNLVDILTPMRRGADDRELAELFMMANLKRHPYNRG